MPNRICLIYIVGTPKETVIRGELSSCSDRVCVLTSEFPTDGYKAYEDYDALRKKLTPHGEWGDGEPNERYYQYEDAIASAKKDSAGEGQIGLFTDVDYCMSKDAEYAETRALVDKYKRLQRDCERRYFRNWRLWRNGHLTKPFTHDRLDELIRKIYPLGGEACGASDFALVSPAGASQGASGVCKGVGDVSEQVKAISRKVKHDLDTLGYCNLVELADFCMSAPYGMAYNGFSAVIMAKVLEKWGNRTLLYYDGCGTFESSDCASAIFNCMFTPSRRRKETVCIYLESQPHKKVKQFMAKLWGVKVEMPGALMGLHLSKELCKTHRIPFKYVDDRLLKLAMHGLDFWNRADVEPLADEIERRGAEILAAYQRYLELNTNIPTYARKMVQVDYSWAWEKEEYERILWQCERFGAWPWNNETQDRANAEWKRRCSDEMRVV